MKKIIRISQKKLNELLMSQMGEETKEVQAEEPVFEVCFKQSELNFIKSVFNEVIGDSPEEEGLIEAVKNTLNNSNQTKQTHEKR